MRTWILIGNSILNLICFLQFFDLSTPSAAKMWFYFLHFLQGKNAQNRPENQQNWNLAKIGLKSDNFMKWKPLRQYLGNVWTIKVILEFWFCHQKCHFFGLKDSTFGKSECFRTTKNCTLGAEIKVLRPPL